MTLNSSFSSCDIDISDEERQRIRREYYEIIRQLQDSNTPVTLENIRAIAIRMDANMPQYMNRELLLDAKVIDIISNIVSEKGSRLKDISDNFRWEDFQKAISNRYKQDIFRWDLLGAHCSCLFREAFPIETCAGAFLRDPPAPRQVTTRQRSSIDSADATSRTSSIYNENEDEATVSRVTELQKTIDSLSKDFVYIDMIKLLVDPKDPIQTIENLFDLSFLVKKKIVSLSIDEESQLPVGSARTQGDNNDDPSNENDDINEQGKQSIMVVDIKELRELTELLRQEQELEKCLKMAENDRLQMWEQLSDIEGNSDSDGNELDSSSFKNSQSSSQKSSQSTSRVHSSPIRSHSSQVQEYPSLHRDDGVYASSLTHSSRQPLNNPSSKTSSTSTNARNVNVESRDSESTRRSTGSNVSFEATIVSPSTAVASSLSSSQSVTLNGSSINSQPSVFSPEKRASIKRPLVINDENTFSSQLQRNLTSMVDERRDNGASSSSIRANVNTTTSSSKRKRFISSQ